MIFLFVDMLRVFVFLLRQYDSLRGKGLVAKEMGYHIQQHNTKHLAMFDYFGPMIGPKWIFMSAHIGGWGGGYTLT